MKHILFILALLFFAYLVFSPPLTKNSCEDSCNIILVVVDTLSAKHMNLYGYERETMPFVSSFFENEIIFEKAYSPAPWTLPSFSSLYFSDLPSRITYHDLEIGNRDSFVSILRDNNYTVRKISEGKGIFINEAVAKPFREKEHVFSNNPEGSVFVEGVKEITSLEESTHPYFVLIHTFDAHDPFDPQGRYSELFEKSTHEEAVTMEEMVRANQNPPVNPELAYQMALKYDQGLREVDDDFKMFIDSLPEEIWEDTYLIFTSDHGEAFGERGTVWHAQSLYEEEVRIPLLIKTPFVSLTQKKYSHPVSFYDIGPTILSIASLTAPETFIGKNLLENSTKEREIYLENGRPFFFKTSPIDGPIPQTLVEAGAHGAPRPIIDVSDEGVLMENRKHMTHKGEPFIFNLLEDPEEKKNLY